MQNDENGKKLKNQKKINEKPNFSPTLLPVESSTSARNADPALTRIFLAGKING